MHGSDEEDAPPSTQLRPAQWVFPETSAVSPTPIAREWSMEQYICFVYRDNSVSTRSPVHVLCSFPLDMAPRHSGHGRAGQGSCNPTRHRPLHDAFERRRPRFGAYRVGYRAGITRRDAPGDLVGDSSRCLDANGRVGWANCLSYFINWLVTATIDVPR